MSSNIIIELRQQDAINSDANGSYECQLSKDVIIESGDVVTINKIFIDSVKEGDINIPNDLTLTINSGVYFMHWNKYDGNTWINKNGSTPEDIISPDFKRFIPYSIVDSGSLTNCTKYNGFEYFLTYAGDWQAFNITYSYLDWQGNLQHIITNIPQVGSKIYKNKPYYDYFNVIAQTGTLKFVSSTNVTTDGWTKIGGIDGGAVDVDILQPFSFQTNILLPAGVYSPLQLTSFLTQKLSSTNSIQSSSSQNMANSNFLFSIDDFNQGKPSPDGRKNPNGTPFPLASQTPFISDDSTIMTIFPNAVNPQYIGASQIALEVDENNRVNWNYLHFPMYDSTNGTNISVRYLHRNLNAGSGVYGVAQNSGIYFQSLIAKDSSGRYVDFWSGQLGFDLSTLCVGTTQINNGFNSTNTIINLSNPLVVGVNITDGYYGLDSAVIKGTNFAERVPVPASQDGLCSTINSTININATETITELLNKFSHYILQTDLGFYNNNYISKTWYRNINGIITKYYSYGSYTFAESDAGIQYIHEGAPIYLKSVKIRLLKSDKTLDINLGDDNTVVLQVMKGGEQMQPVTMPKRA